MSFCYLAEYVLDYGTSLHESMEAYFGTDFEDGVSEQGFSHEEVVYLVFKFKFYVFSRFVAHRS